MFVSIAVPVPLLDALTYRVPDDVEPPVIGARVLVQVGSRTLTGCVVETDVSVPADADRRIKDIVDILDAGPFLPPDVVSLVRWVADYYVCGVGDAAAAAMPPLAWVRGERKVTIAEEGRRRFDEGKIGGIKGELLRALQDGRPVSTAVLAARLRKPPKNAKRPIMRGLHAAVDALAIDGLVTVENVLRGRASAFNTVTVAYATAQADEVAATGENASAGGRALSPAARRAIDALRGRPEGMPLAKLQRMGISADVVRRAAAKGFLSLQRVKRERDPFSSGRVVSEGRDAADGAPPLELTADQQRVFGELAGMAEQQAFRVAVLHGVTGSGKTEIYVRLTEQVCAAGRTALILVPEIALTPVMTARFRASLGDRVAIQHSGLSSGERHDQWQRVRHGLVDVVVGTRSAVFAPLRNLGLIIVDEEHDSSFKQEESPRYHGRDVAVMRARHAGALAVLGSATPSLETFHNAERGRYALLTLERRILDRPLADVKLVDMREEYAEEGPDVILSRRLREALADRLSRGDQAMVLLNRRGYAVAIFCRQCGETLQCPNCSVSLTVHRAARRARCHYCNYAMPLPKTCGVCAGPYMEQLGFGTERVEAEIAALLPQARLARLDRDTVRRRGAIVKTLDRFARREIDVLIGTQMIAKGHDFPGVTLVGVISADVGLGLADFRAGERTFQLLTQVAGRAGRGTAAGEAIIQTLYPQHYSIRHACRQDYKAFYAEEMQFRQAMRYPPSVAMVNTIVRGATAGAALETAGVLVRSLRGAGSGFRVLGPAPAPLVRLKGEHRAQFFLKGTQRAAMRAAVSAMLADHPALRRAVTIDIDPLSVL